MSRRLLSTLGAAPVVVKVYKDSETYGYVARLYLDGVEHEPASYEDSDLEGVKHTAADMLQRSQAHRTALDAAASPKFTSAATLCAAVRDARGDCLDALRKDRDTRSLWLVSRGAWVRIQGTQGSTLNDGDDQEFTGTQAEFAELLKLREREDCAGVYIEGGYNGATDGQAYAAGDYEPWVGEWSVALWAR